MEKPPYCSTLHPQNTPSLSFNPADLDIIDDHLHLTPYLREIITGDRLEAFHNCRNAFARALWCLKHINRIREQRYHALCPRIPEEENARFTAHASSLRRLWSWRDRENPAQGPNSGEKDNDKKDPTLIPAPKIPSFGIKLCVSRRAFDAWLARYNREIERFKLGPYAEFREAKMMLEYRVARGISRGEMKCLDGMMWETFYRELFLGEMEKWERLIEELPVGTFEEIVEDLYWAVLERVEEGERLVAELEENGMGWVLKFVV